MIANASSSGANTVNGPGPESSVWAPPLDRSVARVVRSAAAPITSRSDGAGVLVVGVGADPPTASDASTSFTAPTISRRRTNEPSTT